MTIILFKNTILKMTLSQYYYKSMHVNFCVLRGILFIIFLALSSTNIFAQRYVKINNVEESIYPFNLDTLNFTNDINNLYGLFMDKDIVGMGEATHGTHEFFETKKQLFQFLVIHCNYRIFGIEVSYGAGMYVNDYVKNGVGTLKDVMNYLDWPWSTEEVMDLVEWVKNYNQNKTEKDKITFYGFDIQNITPEIKYLNKFLKKDSSEYSNEIRGITRLLTSKSEFELIRIVRENRQGMKDSLYAIRNMLEACLENNQTNMCEKFGRKNFDRLHLCVENYSQSLNYIYGGNKVYSFRDSCMASNVVKIQKFENDKMFIWAHNGHIGLKYKNLPVMGTYISNRLKEKYYAIGFAFDQGNFMAFKGPNSIAGAIFKFIFNKKKLYKGLIECTAKTYKKNTLTNELKKTTIQSFFIDLTPSHNVLFTTPHYYYDIGATFLNNKHASSKIIAKSEFNGLIFFNVTSATKLLSN